MVRYDEHGTDGLDGKRVERKVRINLDSKKVLWRHTSAEPVVHGGDAHGPASVPAAQGVFNEVLQWTEDEDSTIERMKGQRCTWKAIAAALSCEGNCTHKPDEEDCRKWMWWAD